MTSQVWRKQTNNSLQQMNHIEYDTDCIVVQCLVFCLFKFISLDVDLNSQVLWPNRYNSSQSILRTSLREQYCSSLLLLWQDMSNIVQVQTLLKHDMQRRFTQDSTSHPSNFSNHYLSFMHPSTSSYLAYDAPTILTSVLWIVDIVMMIIVIPPIKIIILQWVYTIPTSPITPCLIRSLTLTCKVRITTVWIIRVSTFVITLICLSVLSLLFTLLLQLSPV